MRTEPTLVAGQIAFVSPSAGRDYACGISTGGDAFCCGDGSTGQLGTDDVSERTVTAPVTGRPKFKQLEARNGTTCGLTTADKAYCWGRNDLQLGVGSGSQLGDQSLVPLPVGDPLATEALRQVAARGPKACALTTAGQAYCWGNITEFELGTTTTRCYGGKQCSLSPVPVHSTDTFSTLASSTFATCGLLSTGRRTAGGWTTAPVRGDWHRE